MKKIFAVLLSTILIGSTAVLCAGCGEKKEELNVFNWGEYISTGEEGTLDTIAEFEERYNVKVNYTNYESNEEMYNLLKESNSSYDVIIPSDYMISKLIEEDMLQKINFDNVPNVKNIMEQYKTTDFDPTGEYSVPYSWGVVALAYNKTMVAEKPTSFDVLWNKDYSGNILMFNNSRDAMAIAMKLK
ncbi:MAG: extracellular solute-binding protein, partial [Acutalibacteraceae bacterium]|nr:extracellular solute-binding protein [Acutalibacteraceae bacterium]